MNRRRARRACAAGPLLAAGAAVGLLMGPAGSAHADAQPPVLTESFESAQGLPAGWRLAEYIPGAASAEVKDGPAGDGNRFLRITSVRANHARAVVPVPVTPGSAYRARVLVRTLVPEGSDVHPLAALEVFGHAAAAESADTGGGWQELVLYVRSGNRSSIDLTVGLGRYTASATGVVDVDAISVAQVADTPQPAAVVDLGVPDPVPVREEPRSAADYPPFSRGPSHKIWLPVSIIVIFGLGAGAYLVRYGEPELPQALGRAR